MQQLLQQMERIVIGQQTNIRLLLTAFLAGGHVLLEGVPGLGKTKMVRTLADLTEGSFSRVQFTPDMMPGDMTGSAIFNMRDNEFQTIRGPVFTNLLLADEINRTPPKTQAALLEAMEERQVTIQGTTYPLPDPFFCRRHAKSGGVRRHVSAAGGAARPVFVQINGVVSVAGGGIEHIERPQAVLRSAGTAARGGVVARRVQGAAG